MRKGRGVKRFALFYHSVISDWNHGNAHFLRGLVRALQQRGHAVTCYEQHDNWSLSNLLAASPTAIQDFTDVFPDIQVERYTLDDNLESWVADRLRQADVAVVHEWNDPSLVRCVGAVAARLDKAAYFHDTHYRVVLDDNHRSQLGLERYQAILAFSPSVASRYDDLGFDRVAVFHEAADTTVFGPRQLDKTTDVVFVGNYGDGDRSDELEEFVFGPRVALQQLRYTVYGVRYPAHVIARMNDGLDVAYGGWLPNVRVPAVYSSARVVLHVPRRQYVELLPGTPTIRVFEALACGACLISLPWPDTDRLFEAGKDFAVARTPSEMRDLIACLTSDASQREAFGQRGRQTILDRHTCGHRADQLLEMLRR
jgi:spore maturation protein CgeB